ncbi:MAG: hypothetical protein Q8928_14935 [Bacteroidota bacterium]|nr:hypothetical protein [Bacteroidota bacterium]
MAQRNDLQYIDLSYLIDYSNGNKKFMSDMMEQCIESVMDVIPKLKLNLEQQNWEKLYEESHKFISVIPFAGFGAILSDMQAIEKLSKTYNPEKEKELRNLVLNAIEYCQLALTELLQEYGKIKE